eukprot:gene8015-5571_t
MYSVVPISNIYFSCCVSYVCVLLLLCVDSLESFEARLGIHSNATAGKKTIQRKIYKGGKGARREGSETEENEQHGHSDMLINNLTAAALHWTNTSGSVGRLMCGMCVHFIFIFIFFYVVDLFELLPMLTKRPCRFHSLSIFISFTEKLKLFDSLLNSFFCFVFPLFILLSFVVVVVVVVFVCFLFWVYV